MKKNTLSALLLFFCGILFSQTINVNTTTYTVPQLVQNVLINSPCAQVSNITWRSGNAAGTTNGIGYFSNSNPNFPMSSGVVMVSGNVSSVPGPNNNIQSNGNWSGDTQLFNYINTFDIAPATPGFQALDPGLTDYNDASIIEFDFLPFTNNMSFNFLFASEEYGTFQCSFSDAFAFFLTNTVTNTTTNLALIPGGTTPIAVTTIRDNAFNGGCSSENISFFDSFNGGANAASSAINFEGQTVSMTAASTVVANNLYHIKLVIADRNDNSYDSAVFIEGGSFNVGVANITYPIGLGGSYTQDMLVSNGQAICPSETRVISTGLDPNNFDFVWTRNGTNLNIDAPSITVSQPGTYCVNASVPGGGTCSQTDCIVVEYFTGFPINNTPGNMTVCNANVNLTSQNTVILSGLDPSVHDVEYYFSMADAQASNNPIPGGVFVAAIGTTPIVAKVINVFAACPEYANFNVIYGVCTIPTVQPSDLVLCDDSSNNGVEIFNLSTQTPVVLGPLNNANYTVTYHLSQAAADAGTGAISPINAYSNISNPQTIYIRVVQNSDTTIFNSSKSFLLRVVPQPVVSSFTGTTTICSGSFTDLTFTGTPNATVTYSDGTTNQTVLLNGSGQAIVSVSPTSITTYSLVNIAINGTPGCTNPATGSVVITLASDNTVSAASSSPTLCVNSALTPITHTTTGATGIGTATGLPAGVTASWSGNTITISGTPTTTVGSPFNYSIPLAGGCGGNATGTITVTSGNTVSAASSSPTLCVNTILTSITHTTTGATGVGSATGLPAGVTATWSGNTITISGTPTSAVGSPFNYTIPLAGGCGTISATGTITVTPNNTVSVASSTPTLCVNTLLTPITHATTGATGIGIAMGLPAGVTASWSGNTITISGTPTTAVGGPFNYTIPLTGGCGTVSATGTITVTPNNTVSVASSTPTLCVNTVLTSITHTTSGATGIGAATGLPTGVTASWAGNTISISGTPTVIGTFNYTIPLTGGCGTVNAIGTITVNPAPTGITILGSTTTCAGIPVNLTVTGTSGTVITWTGSPSSFTIGASGSNVISVAPTTTTTYTLTSASLNGCTIPVLGQSATVTVSATPQFITQIPDITICNGETLDIASQLTSTVPGASFIWSATTSNVNTAAFSGDQTNIDQIVNLINTLQNGTVNIEVKPQIGSCSGTPQQILVTVKPIPVITSTVVDKPIICNNEFITITANSNPVATVYTWQVNTATGVQIVGGATSGTSTTGIVNLQLALTNPLVAGTISFDFTPVNGICTGATITNAVTITVNPIPGTPIGLPVDEICSGETTNLTISSFPTISGTTLEWTVIDSQNVTGFANGTGTAPFTINDLLINTSNVQGFVKYSVTSKLGNCEGGTTEYTVLVNPLPKPNLLDGHICVNQTTNVTYQSYILDAQLSNPNFTYDWYVLNTATGLYDILSSANESTYEVAIAGTYQVIVTNIVTNCASQPVQAVVSTIYPATAFTSEVTDAFTNNATITVTVNPIGTGNLIYSLDGGAWQSSNVFTGVEAGSHEVMVEDLEGCTNLAETIEVIGYPKYFTPNGDGFNDKWKIVGLEVKHNAKIYIFDRYGKLIKQIDPLGEGWDGKYNGQDTPSTDYWFNVDYIENNQQKQFKAHFSLKR
jgi:gliding motility-associated-like protein